METPEERPDLGTATRIYNHMRPVMQDLDVEEFWALLLNQHYRLIKKVRISHGGITETSAGSGYASGMCRNKNDMEDLFKLADQAMYKNKNKKAGREQ